MKILLISTNYSPELTGIGKYSGEMVEWLVANGHDVHVICSPPYYPEWNVHKGYKSFRYCKETKQNQKVYRCPIWVPAKPTGLKRVIHLLSFAVSSFPVVLSQLFWRPDVVISIEPPLFNSIGALIVSKVVRAPSILHIHDFEVDAAFDLGIIKQKKIRSVIHSIELFLMRRFKKVSTISPMMIKKLQLKGVSSEDLILFPNWVDTSRIYPLESCSKYRQDLNIKDDYIVALYSGNMGEKQGLDLIINAAKALKCEKIIFIMCGSGSSINRLKEKAEGLENIIWLPLQPIERLNEFLNVADIHLLPQLEGAEDLVMPSKLTGMLSSGRPVVATANKGTQVESIVRSCGKVVPPSDLEGFVNGILSLSKNPSLRRELGYGARNYAVQCLGQRSIMKCFEKVLIDLVK